MKKIIFIIIALIVIIILGIFIYFYNSLDKKDSNSLEKKDSNFIYNQKYNEKIYFIKLSWGLDDEMSVISLTNQVDVASNKDETYFAKVANPTFFYKLYNDTLFIYSGHFIPPKINKFKTPIKQIFLENPEFIKLKEKNKYKMEGLKMFPPGTE